MQGVVFKRESHVRYTLSLPEQPLSCALLFSKIKLKVAQHMLSNYHADQVSVDKGAL